MYTEGFPEKTLLPPPSQDEARRAELLAYFDALDERGKVTTLALIATAAKLHPKADHGDAEANKKVPA